MLSWVLFGVQINCNRSNTAHVQILTIRLLNAADSIVHALTGADYVLSYVSLNTVDFESPISLV